MADIESGSPSGSQTLSADDGAFGLEGSASDVPQLPKPISCAQTPQCETFRQGAGCEHAMSKAEMESWLERLRGHRVSVESGGGRSRSTSVSKPKTPKREEFEEA